MNSTSDAEHRKIPSPAFVGEGILLMMSLVLYNTYSKREEPFTTQKKGIVTMYTCGPTVYGRPHIGNYSSFLMADLLRRWLQTGHKLTVKHVKNITDVGHLLHDNDHGDDKVQKEAEREKLHPLEIAKRYTEQYLQDERALNILEPDFRPRASEFVPQMVTMIKALQEKGNAYETVDGVYFATSTFPLYGGLSGNTPDQILAGARVQLNESKKHPADFALWKKCVGDNARHVLRWKFSDGSISTSTGDDPSSGFPGWHIECSAMSQALLGDQIDIHTGGEDNIFPHHECEVAQSESATGKKPFVRMWVHKRRIDMGAAKMSKSLGNVLTLSDISERGFSPLDLRYYLLSVHYRTNLKFSWKGLEDAKKARKKILEWIEEVQSQKFQNAKSDIRNNEEFDTAMNADLNTPQALAEIFNTMNLYHAKKISDVQSCRFFIEKIQKTFGCFEKEEEGIPEDVQSLLDQRQAARETKDFAESDRLRDEIKKKGYDVRDTDKGQVARRI